MSEPGIFLLVFVGISVVVALIIAITLLLESVQRRKEEYFEGTSRRLKGRYLPSGFMTPPRIEFPLAGRTATVEFVRPGEDDRGRTCLTVPLNGPSPGTLHILKEGFGQSFLRMFGAQDLSVGDPAFDDVYVIKASPESLAAKVFSPDRRARVMAAVRALEGLAHPTIELTRDQLRVQVREELRVEGLVVTLAKTAEQFLEFIQVAPGAAGIQLGEVQTSGTSTCPVCGTGMDDLVVRCEACKTPHHSECWTYVGQCSTYACTGKRCVA